jgi:SAM-dependent methyltransferase
MAEAPRAGEYEEQERGSIDAYQRYLDGMDASMRQKVALTAAHLLCRGKVADMGMGSGTGSYSFAALYPALEVTGVDVNPEMVRLAVERHRLPNLKFVVGDIAEPVFPPGSLDAILDSSVLHHVTSFNDYDYAAAERALANQVAALKEHGVLVVRDFLDPGAGSVRLDVPHDDGDDTDDPRSCSSAALLQRFSKEFRSLAAEPGFPLQLSASAATHEGFRRYELSLKHAVEFLLRKDYRADWESEVKEEYTYFTQARFEAVFRRLGLRVLASVPLRNRWIVRHRLEGRYALECGGEALDHPPTNYVIVGERVRRGEGVRIESTATAAPVGFLELNHFRHRESGRVYDLVRRPHLTIDVLPWFEAGRDLFVLVRSSYPRPIVAAYPEPQRPLDGSSPPHYLIEPLNVLQGDKPLGQTVEEALGADAGLEPARLRAFRSAGTYYPSPGGIQEEVRAMHVEIEPTLIEKPLESRSGFSTSGHVRAIEARQLLRAAQVGALPDARLELNVYELLLERAEPAGPWIGESLELSEGNTPPAPALAAELFARPHRRAFVATAGPGAGFLRVQSARFRELDASGTELASQTLEYVVPTARSSNTIAVAALRRASGAVWIAVDCDDMPAAQCFTGNSDIVVAPAWRLPHEITSETRARRWVFERLRAEYGAVARDCWELGGPYRPSPGVTPETVFPIAVELESDAPAPRQLEWLRLDDLIRHISLIVDGHLRVVALRAAHAVGLLANGLVRSGTQTQTQR